MAEVSKSSFDRSLLSSKPVSQLLVNISIRPDIEELEQLIDGETVSRDQVHNELRFLKLIQHDYTNMGKLITGLNDEINILRVYITNALSGVINENIDLEGMNDDDFNSFIQTNFELIRKVSSQSSESASKNQKLHLEILAWYMTSVNNKLSEIERTKRLKKDYKDTEDSRKKRIKELELLYSIHETNFKEFQTLYKASKKS